MACINAYRLYLLHTDSTKPLSHIEFRIKLYRKLLAYSKQVQLIQLYSELGGKRLFNPEIQHIHFWEKLPIKRGICTWCSYYEKYCKRVESIDIVSWRHTTSANRSTLPGKASYTSPEAIYIPFLGHLTTTCPTTVV